MRGGSQELRLVCREMREALREVLREVRLRKSLGQNFMRSCSIGNLFLKWVMRFRPKSVLEVGAGAGLLTLFLALSGARVIAVELDPRLTPILRRNVFRFPNVFPLEGDGVSLIESSAVRADGIASNTPYSISGPLVAAFVKSRLNWAVLTLQEEVALKLAAAPGSRNYGKISVLTQLFCKVTVDARISPKAFIPAPEVTSRLVVLERRKVWRPLYNGIEGFLKCIFSQRRRLAYKVINRCVRSLSGGSVTAGRECLDIGGKRVYELSPEEILRLYLAYLTH